MRKFRALMLRLRGVFDRHRGERDFNAELESHIALHTEEGIRAGLDFAQARRQALIHLRGAEQTRQAYRDRRTLPVLESLLGDTRFALRQLSRSPGFAVTVILTLALGIGANLAVFQLLYSVLFAELPVQRPGQIHSLHAVPSPFDGEWFFSFPAYRRLRAATPEQAPVFARSGFGVGVLQQSDGSATRNEFQLVSDNFFAVLGLQAAAGRFFLDGDDQRIPSEWPVILRYGYFKQRFAADRSVVGKRAVFNGVPIVIVGVAPEGFTGIVPGEAPDLWLPLAAHGTMRFGTWFDSLGPGHNVNLDHSWIDQPTIFWLWTLARTPQGSQAAARAHWGSAIAPDLHVIAEASKDPRDRTRILSTPVSLVSAAYGEGWLAAYYRSPLVILMAMAAVILLVGCLNLANLQMARLVEREREIATRIALGATRTRILRQVVIEAFVLAVCGGLFAFAAGRASTSVLLRWASGRGEVLPVNAHIGLAATALGAALLLLALAGFGLIPAWRMTRKSFATASRARVGALASQSKTARRWSNLLLAAQVSLSLLLLSSAALFAQTLRNLSRVDAGLDRAHVLSVHLDMRSTGFASRQTNLSPFYDSILEQLRALPDVTDAAVHMCTIPACGWNTALHVYGTPDLAESQLHGEEDHIGLGYFQTLGISILQGRDFARQDTPKSEPVAILSRSYARKLFSDRSPLGHRIGYSGPPLDHEYLIVGEVADARVDGLHAPAPPVAYFSLEQRPDPVQAIELRVHGPLNTLPAEIRHTLYRIAPALPVTEIVPLDDEFSGNLSSEELLARLTSVFGVLSLALAALGFYGLLSFRVARRASEIGIRMALGATRGQVQTLFLAETLAILLIGFVPGAVLSLIMASVARKLLYGAATMNGWAVAFSVCVLVAAGLVATSIPARRAASIDPMQALRGQ
jgi:predicted permease